MPARGVAPGMTQVLQLRVVVEAENWEQAVAFFRDTLGLATEFELSTGAAKVIALQAGRATLELANPAQRAYIDAVEVGRDVAPPIRLAFEVVDVDDATGAAVAGGAQLIAPVVRTPWDSRNSRLAAPGGVQITLFEEAPTTEP